MLFSTCISPDIIIRVIKDHLRDLGAGRWQAPNPLVINGGRTKKTPQENQSLTINLEEFRGTKTSDISKLTDVL